MGRGIEGSRGWGRGIKGVGTRDQGGGDEGLRGWGRGIEGMFPNR